jgi:hypothetical protein
MIFFWVIPIEQAKNMSKFHDDFGKCQWDVDFVKMSTNINSFRFFLTGHFAGNQWVHPKPIPRTLIVGATLLLSALLGTIYVMMPLPLGMTKKSRNVLAKYGI